jgi:transposase-like protein
MALMARPRLLTEHRLEEIALHVELGGSVAGAAERVGCSTRSLRRWRAKGGRELAALSPEAKLVLRLARAEEQARSFDWEHTARLLELEPIDLDF